MTASLLLALAAVSWAGQSFDELRAQADERRTTEPPVASPKLQDRYPGLGAPAGRSVLLLGDSHMVGRLGSTLYERLGGPDTRVALLAVCGASMAWWLRGQGDNTCGYTLRVPGRPDERGGAGEAAPHRQKELERLLAAGPSTVVIGLGANNDNDLVGNGAELLRRVPPGSRCVWIAPPPVPKGTCRDYDRGDFSRTFDRMKAAAGRDCELVDTAQLLDASWASGCHFSECGEQWGEAAAARITGVAAPARPRGQPDCSKPRPSPATRGRSRRR